jgi:hypothetical protein
MNQHVTLQSIARPYHLSAIYAFGSRAQEIALRVRDNEPLQLASPSPDVDIGVHPSAGHVLSARDRVRIAVALEDLFSVYRVDLVVVPETRPFLALDIIRGELIYCEDLDEQAEFELYVLRRAGDLAYYERERIRLILSGERT